MNHTPNPMYGNKYEPDDEMVTRLHNDFFYHAPKGDQVDRFQRIRRAGCDLAFAICRMAPPSRELSIALTKLDEVIFWANAAIARNE